MKKIYCGSLITCVNLLSLFLHAETQQNKTFVQGIPLFSVSSFTLFSCSIPRLRLFLEDCTGGAHALVRVHAYFILAQQPSARYFRVKSIFLALEQLPVVESSRQVQVTGTSSTSTEQVLGTYGTVEQQRINSAKFLPVGGTGSTKKYRTFHSGTVLLLY